MRVLPGPAVRSDSTISGSGAGPRSIARGTAYALRVSKLSTATKRLLLGRPFRSDTLGHTLLPKRIALPVFASDALSSVAYAPEEIFLVLSVAGMSAFVFAPWIGVMVAIVLAVVVASYRQNVHAYPSGGGDYEVATVNLGPTAGLTVGSASWSTMCSPSPCRSRRPRRTSARRCRSSRNTRCCSRSPPSPS